MNIGDVNFLTKAKSQGDVDYLYSNFDTRIDVITSAIGSILFSSSINGFAL